MGGGSSKPDPPVEQIPSIQQVKDELESILSSAALSELARDFPEAPTPSDTTLQDYAGAIAQASFNKDFSYQWSSSSCSPPNPPYDNGPIHPVHDYCLVDTSKASSIFDFAVAMALGASNDDDDDDSQSISDAITEYVNSALASSGLEDWMQHNASADLTAVITNYLNYHPDNAWHHDSYTNTYNASNVDTDSYKIDLSFAYTNATLTDSCVEATLHILYFVGVYYTVKSPTKAAYGELQSTAYSQAQALSDATVTVNSPDTLKRALTQHMTPLIKSAWGYDYPAGNPPDFASDEKGAMRGQNEGVCYLTTKTPNESYLSAYVDDQIMKGLNITIRTVADSVKNDIMTVFKSFLSTPLSGSWSSDTRIDQGYELQSAAPIRINALVMYWYDKKSLIIDDADEKSKSVVIETVYLSFVGIVYQLIPDPIADDLMLILYKNIYVDPKNPVPQVSKVTTEQLKLKLEAYNISKFLDAYGFAFPKANTGQEKVWKRFFHFDAFHPKDSDMEAAIVKNLFGPDDKGNPQIKHGNQAGVYKFIVESLEYYSGTSYQKEVNDWYSETREDNLMYNVKGVDWTTDARISCAFGSSRLTEDGRGAETIERFYLSLLLDVRAEKYTEEADEV